MNTILTDDEIKKAIAPLYAGEKVLELALIVEMDTARAVESAVLAKLAQQTPVAWIQHGRSRRLHAENEANERNLCQLTDELAKTVTLLRQALELLEDNREDVARVETTYMHTHYDPVLHAIKRHLENGS